MVGDWLGLQSIFVIFGADSWIIFFEILDVRVGEYTGFLNIRLFDIGLFDLYVGLLAIDVGLPNVDVRLFEFRNVWLPDIHVRLPDIDNRHGVNCWIVQITHWVVISSLRIASLIGLAHALRWCYVDV